MEIPASARSAQSVAPAKFNQTFLVDDSPTGWWVTPDYFGKQAICFEGKQGLQTNLRALLRSNPGSTLKNLYSRSPSRALL